METKTRQDKAIKKDLQNSLPVWVFWRLVDERHFYSPNLNIGIYQKSLGYRLSDYLWMSDLRTPKSNILSLFFIKVVASILVTKSRDSPLKRPWHFAKAKEPDSLSLEIWRPMRPSLTQLPTTQDLHFGLDWCQLPKNPQHFAICPMV